MRKMPGLAIWEHTQAHWCGLYVPVCVGGGSAARVPARRYVGSPGGRACAAVAHPGLGAGSEVPSKKVTDFNRAAAVAWSGTRAGGDRQTKRTYSAGIARASAHHKQERF